MMCEKCNLIMIVFEKTTEIIENNPNIEINEYTIQNDMKLCNDCTNWNEIV